MNNTNFLDVGDPEVEVVEGPSTRYVIHYEYPLGSGSSQGKYHDFRLLGLKNFTEEGV